MNKKILVVGSGGREHAICWKLAQSKLAPQIFCAPGNGGTSAVATNVPIAVEEIEKLAAWCAQNEIDFTIVGPEVPLALGIVDHFEKQGLKIFGVTKAAAQLEASKAFSKEIMIAAGVETAEGGVFTDIETAKRYIQENDIPIVVKADGLAAGKGVVVAETRDEALTAIDDFMGRGTVGTSGNVVVIEHCLRGREASIIAMVDGMEVVPFVVSQDYKRVFDEDKGPNTGGMGAISPTPVLSESRLDEAKERIFLPVLRELKSRGIDYRGFLYAGVMVLPDGRMSVLEFNCRLGDPETQILMMRLKSDLVLVMDSIFAGDSARIKLEFTEEAAACVVLAAEGYPGKVTTGDEITIDRNLIPQGVQIFHAGTKIQEGKLVTSGGRVLAVSAMGETLNQALAICYEGIAATYFRAMHFRKDIGVSR